MRRNNFVMTVMGGVLFFLTILVTVTVSLVVFVKINRETDGNGWVIAVVILLLIFFFTLVFTIIDLLRRKHMIDTPVSQILRMTDSISRGDFSVRGSVRHPYGSYDEFDVIIENLNTVAVELGKSEVLKNDFISAVSHEFKTPLAVIRSYAALAEAEGEPNEKGREYLATVSEAAGRLNSLVTNILKLNRLENHGIRPEKDKVDITAQLSEVIISYEDRIEEKEIALNCELSDVRLNTSAEYLEMVWHNLISNAVKFTERGGSIDVTLTAFDGGATVKISDTGCGISPEVGARIFEKFYQGDTSRAGEGNGLGLALVKKVIDLIGGEVSVKSELGVGSTFTVTLYE